MRDELADEIMDCKSEGMLSWQSWIVSGNSLHSYPIKDFLFLMILTQKF